jgi:putative DNA primase/helicase
MTMYPETGDASMPIADTSRRLDDADIDRAQAVSIGDVASERGLALDRADNHAGPCPKCGGVDRFSISVHKGAFLCRQCHPKGGGGAISLVMFLDNVVFRDAVMTLTGARHTPERQSKPVPVARNSADHDRRQRHKAAWLWSQCKPITGSIAEVYLRQARKITCPLPPTLGFLPSRRPDRHPAMIAAFGFCDEVEPGVLAAPRDVQAVHLTLLKPDGSGKAEVEPDKLMIGSPGCSPIVLAPPNDLLGLAICEGVEDALTAHEATGLGAWAAGSAGRMAALADSIPDYIEALTIFAHADKPGQHGARALAAALRSRDIEITMEGI